MKPSYEELERQGRATEAILNQPGKAILCVDEQRRILWVNRLAASLAGIPQLEAIGRPCTLFAGIRQLCPTCRCDRTLRNGETRNELVGVETEEGGKRYWSCETGPLSDSEGRIFGVVRISRMVADHQEPVEMVEISLSGSAFPSRGTLRQKDQLNSGPFLSVCSSCKDIRDPDQNWHRLDNWLERQLGVCCTHSICPPCLKKLYPDFY